MKPSFIYIPTDDLEALGAFYRETLGFTEAWREGDDTIAFTTTESDVQLMVSSAPGAQGPMYQVPSTAEWLAAHAELDVVVPLDEIPGGAVVGLRDPAGNAFYVFHQED